MTEAPRGPLKIELDELPGLDEPEGIEEEAEARVAAMARAARPSGRLSRWFWRALGALVALALSLWAWDFVTGLLARSTVLGGIATALIAVVAVVLLALALREWAAIARLGRLEGMRRRALEARASADMGAAQAVAGEIARLYRGRADAAWGLQRFAEPKGDAFDAGALLDLAEREVLGPLALAARAEVEAAAARVATLTALIPLALVDVAAALWTNLAMIRRLTAIYGGRAGTLGAWRITRAVVGHLAATGAVAVGDDLLGPAIGGGLAAKLSRRFGEGLINGAMTVRVGAVAMEMCRPVPFAALERPGRAAMLRRALTGVFRKDGVAPG